MVPRRWKRNGILAGLLLSGFLCFHAIQWWRWREHADIATNVAIELQPAYQVIKVDEQPSLSVRIVNRGNQEVILVQPRDGSERGWRTPIVEWSIDPWFHGPDVVS
jgi:hypothetical protein